MKKTLNDLITNPNYYVHHTERRFGYYSVHAAGVAAPYKGIYGSGYRVFMPITNGKEKGIFIIYFIRREEKRHV